MEMRVFTDRVRTSPSTGAVIPRDQPASEAARSLETAFRERRVWRAPRGGVAAFQVVISTDEPSDGAEITVTAGPFSSSGTALSEPMVFYQWPCMALDAALDRAVPLRDSLDDIVAVLELCVRHIA